MPRHSLMQALLTFVTGVCAAHAQQLYWTDLGTMKIQRGNVDGTGIEDLVTAGLMQPQGIALDGAAGKMYWTDLAGQEIRRADTGGGNIELLVMTGPGSQPSGIALDADGGKMYWADAGGSIHRADLDGGNVEDLITAGLGMPNGIALDVAGGKMYWAAQSPPFIRRADLDGGNVEDLVSEGFVTQIVAPFGITLDVSAGKMYWTDLGKQAIQRADMEIPAGATPNFRPDLEDVVGGLPGPVGIAVDPAAGKMYWSDAAVGMIQSANLDGSQVQDLEFAGLQSPLGLVLALCGSDADCDDGLFCTGVETCNVATGSCQPGTDPCAGAGCDEDNDMCGCVDNDACDDGDVCTTDLCVGGSCESLFNTDPCDDNDPCTMSDACDGAGACTGIPMDCTGLDDQCNVGVCNAVTGVCEAQPANVGGSCDDGDPCTEGDVCDASGVCGGSAVNCSGLDDACNMGVCNANSGVCEAQPANEGGACDDGDACTTGDTCASGVCGGGAVDCSMLDDACNVGVCNAGTGVCEAQPVNEGGVCDDGEGCTTGDVCTAGVCGGVAVDCSMLDDACNVGVCDATTGVCEAQPMNAGGACDDADACTEGDVCDASGGCAGTPLDPAVACDDSNACTIDTCDTVNGCTNTPDVGASCDDGNACTSGDACDASGTCIGSPSGSAGDPCDDGDLCTENDQCDDVGGCAGTPVTCEDDGNPCTVDGCDPVTGNCNVPDVGAACDDGNVCTMDDTCSAAGDCAGTPDDTAACDDGVFCNGVETCTNGNCASAGDPCASAGQLCSEESDACVGCTSNADCADGNFCNGVETCVSSVCVPGPPVACDDGVACTVDSCDEINTTCVHTPTDSACDDGAFCNGAEACDVVNGCQEGDDPCPGQSCDEETNACVGPVVPTGPQGNSGTVGPLGDVVVDVTTIDGLTIGVVDVTGGTTGQEVQVELVQNGGAPGIDGVNTFAGFVNELALGITLRVTTTMGPGTYTAVVQLTVPQSSLQDLGLSPEEAVMHVLDTTSDPPAWTIAGTNSVGRSDPTQVPGDYGYQISDDSATYWVVRTVLSGFAVGQALTPAPGDGGAEPPGQDTPPADGGEMGGGADQSGDTPGGEDATDAPGAGDTGDTGDGPSIDVPPEQPNPDDVQPACGAAPCGTLGFAFLPMVMLGLVTMRRRIRRRR